MAKRKPARATRPAARKRPATSRPGSKSARARRATKKVAPKRAPATSRTVTKRKAAAAAPRKPAVRKAVARKPAPRRVAPRKVASPKAHPPRAKKPDAIKKSAPVPKAVKPSRPARKSPALERERRTWDESVIPGPPSSLDLDRTASAARSGRRQMLDRYASHTETSPALTGGDIDGDWESASAIGDEAPGGDNPTPDQDLVDDIGQAVGLVYEDNEELEGEAKVSDRDRHRWELDPASSDDFDDR